ncbi:ubiquinone biosynthesis protein UbiJ [Bisgaardia hudsonensis]|uniref:Ubiquinone biosynthesis accessory factor UbiJ n=1 Tax=Bisgaardia hudsonensis TaxID=109472 RepID=A0A4V2SJA2_9PAST|nr:SCP2 domain-containing protein [Bisgaardia hudsonensis]QLB12421.1 hypothetical protein A6A11_01740 [Bisgaardia hudsonensis]TCP13950.1 ubiquinone biosynthesis protein UbiJ [Bisgaardia hudsonensis]
MNANLEFLKSQLLFPQWLNAGLETLLNQLIDRTAHCEPYFHKLNGKVLAIRLQKLATPIHFIFSEKRIDLLNQYEGDVDCAVTVAPSLLLKMPKKSQISEYINDQSIQLQGDLQVLQDFVGLIEFLEKDPAELISPYVGDVVAHSAVSFLGNFVAIIKQKLTQSEKYWGERLTEEWQLLSPSLAIADFCDQVKILAKQTALLEQKLLQLEK